MQGVTPLSAVGGMLQRRGYHPTKPVKQDPAKAEALYFSFSNPCSSLGCAKSMAKEP
jgi:hypothetical protein